MLHPSLPFPPSRAGPATDARRPRGGWLPAAAADGSHSLPVLLLSFFTRIISEIKFTHVVFCDGYGMTGKEKEGKKSVLQGHLVDLLLLLVLVKYKYVLLFLLWVLVSVFWSSRMISC